MGEHYVLIGAVDGWRHKGRVPVSTHPHGRKSPTRTELPDATIEAHPLHFSGSINPPPPVCGEKSLLCCAGRQPQTTFEKTLLCGSHQAESEVGGRRIPSGRMAAASTRPAVHRKSEFG